MMTLIRRYTVDWTGFPGGPGVSTFYTTNVDGAAANLHAMFTSIAPHLATGVEVQVNNVGLVIEDTNGEAQDNYSDTAQTLIVSGGIGAFIAPAGAHINWLTSGFVAGRQVRGKTFVVPLDGGAYDATGTLLDPTRDDIANAANTFVTASAGTFLVWARPFDGDPAATPPKPARDGSSHAVTSIQVPDKVAVLTSRRD